MAAVHLIKLSVGTETVDDLRRWQQRQAKRSGRPNHVTRMFPKRAEELKDGGSIYWVIAGQIRARQRILDLDAVSTKAGTKCKIVLDEKLVSVAPAPRGPFQGWRYLKPEDAPRDLPEGLAPDDAVIHAELAELGLL
jgi:hypothetical protein